MTLLQPLVALLPEVVLLVGGLVILILDMLWHKAEDKKRWLPYVSLAWLAGSLAAAIATWLSAGGRGPQNVPMLHLDGAAMFVRIVATLVVAVVILSSIEYMRGKTPYRGEFYAFLLFAALGMMLMAAGSNLVIIYIAFELLSLASYVLTGYLRRDVKSNEAAIKYFLYGAIVSAVMLYGMSFLYGATGSTDLAAIAQALGEGGGVSARWLAFASIVLVFAGLGFKIAAVPFHQWAPDAYEGAPTPVTAFLSVGPKAAGFVVLLRVLIVAFPQFEPDWGALMAAVAMVTMTLGNVVAIVQKNIKRMIAYSSIAQAGYILVGVAALGVDKFGVQGVLLYLLVYLFANLGLFSVIIAVYNTTGSDDIEAYAGLNRRSPWLAAGLAVFFLSLVGIPPTAGFFGKFLIFAAAVRTDMIVLAAVGVANGVVSLYYYFAVVRQAYFLPPEEDTPIRIAPGLRAALLVCMVVVLGVIFFMQPLLRLIQALAATLA